MKTALVIDDNETILEDMGERLRSMGIAFVCARCQEEAEEVLKKEYFDIILSDLQIPVHLHGRPREEHGKNLVRKLREDAKWRSTPVIVITGFGKNGPHLGVEMMKLGATDFINKDDESVSVEERIREALREKAPVEKGQEERPVAFEGGFLVFHEDRVELRIDEIALKVCGSLSHGTIRGILNLLREKREKKDARCYDGKYLADCLNGNNKNLARTDERVREAIRDFRALCIKKLAEVGITCGRDDIIERVDGGYVFKEWIGVSGGRS